MTFYEIPKENMFSLLKQLPKLLKCVIQNRDKEHNKLITQKGVTILPFNAFTTLFPCQKEETNIHCFFSKDD